MRPEDLLRSALEALGANRLRSTLTALGVIIGVASLVAMMSIGAGATARIDEVIGNLGTNLLTITPGVARNGPVALGEGSRVSLTSRDLAALRAGLGNSMVAGQASGAGQVLYGGRNWSTQVQGVSANYPTLTSLGLATGRWLNAEDERGALRVGLIGASLREELFGQASPLGKTVRVNRVPVQIVGELAVRGRGAFGQDQDNVLMVPLSTAQRRILGGGQIVSDAVSSLIIRAPSADQLTGLQRQATRILRQSHQLRASAESDFTVRDLAQFISARTDALRALSALLAAVAGIALIVGGIGIMNIMLVSVSERTREIGLRMAVGARHRDIRDQFLLESTLLSTSGGIIGLALGLAATFVIATFADFPLRVSWSGAAMAMGFSALVGLGFGSYPAARAARLDPIVALRRE